LVKNSRTAASEEDRRRRRRRLRKIGGKETKATTFGTRSWAILSILGYY